MDSESNTVADPPRTWWKTVILILLVPIVMPITFLVVGVPLFIIAAISVPVSAVKSRLELRRERRFQDSLAERNRCLPWESMLDTFASIGGSLIVEWRHKRPVRLWWTTDDVVALAPCELPEFFELDFLGLEPVHPFIDWCHATYTDDETGTATLCIPPCNWSPGTKWSIELQQQFPKLSAVNVVSKYDPPAQSAT